MYGYWIGETVHLFERGTPLAPGAQPDQPGDSLAQYRELMASGRLRPGSPRRATLELGLRLEQMFIEFWCEATAAPHRLPGAD